MIMMNVSLYERQKTEYLGVICACVQIKVVILDKMTGCSRSAVNQHRSKDRALCMERQTMISTPHTNEDTAEI